MSQIQRMSYKLRKFWPLPSVIGTRFFASEHGRHSGPKQGSGLPPWIKVPDLYENPDLLKNVKADAAKFRVDYEPDALVDFFEKRVRPFISPRCLLFERPMSDTEVRKVHLMNRDLSGRYPLYTSSTILMKRMVKLNEEHQNNLLQFLVLERVLVFKDWDWNLKLAPIECLFYDHGTQLAPQPCSTDSCTYKAESDASFHVKSKTATLAALIWKLGLLLDVQVNWGLSCESSTEAECLAAASALERGRDLKDANGADLTIDDIEVVIDSEYNYKVLAGILDVDPKYPDVCMAALQVARQYDTCKFRWVPREAIPIVDEMSRAKYSPVVDVEELIHLHSSKLWGCPIFRINDGDNRKLSTEALAKRVKKKDIVFPKCSYIRAEGYTEKLDALLGLLSVLEPHFLIVLVDSHELASKMHRSLTKYDCRTLTWNGNSDQMTSRIYDWCPTRYRALLLVNGSVIPPLDTKQALVVAFNEPTDPITYSQSEDSSGVLTITFRAHSDKDTGQDKEVDPTLYGFFRSYEPYGKPQVSFNIMTYNLCGKEDGDMRDRFFALEDVVEEHDPDFICFQSISPKMHLQLQKHEWWKNYYCSVHLPNVGEASNYLMQMSKLPATFRSIPCTTIGEFSTAAVTIREDRKLLVATCSLEGKCTATKTLQAKEIFTKLSEDEVFKKTHNDTVICGGMSWNDKLEGRFPLASGWTDAWEEIRTDEEGFTCQLSGNPARADRVVCKVPGYNIDKIDLVGKDSSPTISEHLGLVARISYKLK